MKSDSTTVIKNMEFLVKELHKEWDRSGASKASVIISLEEVDGINVHVYGAHIFHTSDKAIWEYINQFAEFNNYINSPIAVYKDELYNLPFNMNLSLIHI